MELLEKLDVLDLSSCTALTDDSVKVVLTNCRQLVKLSLSRIANLSSKCLISLAVCCCFLLLLLLL